MIFLTALIDGDALYEGDNVFVRHLCQDKDSTDEFSGSTDEFSNEAAQFADSDEELLSVQEIKVQALSVSIKHGRVYLVHTAGVTPIDCVKRNSILDHSDDFIYYDYGQNMYPRFFLMLQRLPAALKLDFAEFIKEYRLFALYKNVWYRVTGASRMGDIWLQSDFNRTRGYEIRVSAKDIEDWQRGAP